MERCMRRAMVVVATLAAACSESMNGTCGAAGCVDAAAGVDHGGPSDEFIDAADLGDDQTPSMDIAMHRWKQQQSGTTLGLANIWGSGPTDIYINASDQTSPASGILHSDDGSSWTTLHPAVTPAYGGVGGTGYEDVYVTGQVTLHTTDRGKTWTQEFPPCFPCEAVAALGSDVFVTGVDGVVVHKTTDANSQWTRISAMGGGMVLGVLPMVDGRLFIAQQGILGDGGAFSVLVTADLGKTWAVQNTGGVQGLPSDIWAASGSELYAVGWGRFGMPGILLHTNNGGMTWERQTINLIGALYAVWGSAPDDVYVAGWPDAGGSALFHSSDHGKTWKPVSLPIPASTVLGGIWGTSATNIYIVGESGLILHYR